MDSNKEIILTSNYFENNSGEDNQRVLKPYITIHDINYWRFKAIEDLLIEMTDYYSSVFGCPTRIIDITPESFSEKIFYGRIIIYEDAKKIVIIDRISHTIIPFGSILKYNPIDMSKVSMIGGDLSSNWSVSPMIGASLIGSLAGGFSSGGIIGGAAISREYTQKPIRTFTVEDYGIEITTNDMQEPCVFVYFNNDTNAFSQFTNILEIILHNDENKNDNSKKIFKQDFQFGDIFSKLYSKEIVRLQLEDEELQKEKARNAEELRSKNSSNSGCMVSLLIVIIASFAVSCFISCQEKKTNDSSTIGNAEPNTEVETTAISPIQTLTSDTIHVEQGLNQNVESIPEEPKKSLETGKTYKSNQGNRMIYYGYDGFNYVIETDVKLSQNEVSAFMEEYNIPSSYRLNLTFQKGELLATYAYVENGVVKYDNDGPPSKKGLKKYIYQTDIDDAHQKLDEIPAIKSQYDYSYVFACFENSAQDLEDIKKKYGNTTEYRALKNKFYKKQQRLLGRVEVETY